MRPAGAVALAGGLLTLAAFVFDASPLFVPGAALIVLGAGVPAWIWMTARGGRVQRRLQVATAIEGEPVDATIEITRGALGLPGAEVLDPFTGSWLGVAGALGPVSSGRRAHIHVVAHFERRGRKQLAPPSLRVKDPLALVIVTKAGNSPTHELLVLPRTEPVRWSDRGGWRIDRAFRHAAVEAAPASQPDGLRPYRPGAPASRIHWPALARGAGLLERRFQADSDTRPVVVLDARCKLDSPQLDAAVRAAASLALELGRQGGCGVLLPGERRPIEIDRHLGAWPGVHARLAVVQGGPGVTAPALGHLGGLGGILYVAAQPLARLPLVLRANPHLMITLVLPKPLHPERRSVPTFEVAGCRGFLLTGARRKGLESERAA